MGFLYFFPGQIISDPKRFTQQAVTLERCGLSDVFRGANISYREVHNRGPNGGGGCVCSIGDMPDNFGYYPEKQTWVEVKDADGKPTHWLGWSELPWPKDLLRGKAPEGHPVEMGDGREWIIPCVQAVSQDRVTLPQAMRMSPDGSLTAEIMPGYEALISEAQWWWDLLANGGQYEWGRYWNYAVSLLSVCYRVSREEVNVLGLLKADTRHHHEVVLASLGIPDVEAEAQKKMDTLADTSDTSHGDAA